MPDDAPADPIEPIAEARSRLELTRAQVRSRLEELGYTGEELDRMVIDVEGGADFRRRQRSVKHKQRLALASLLLAVGIMLTGTSPHVTLFQKIAWESGRALTVGAILLATWSIRGMWSNRRVAGEL